MFILLFTLTGCSIQNNQNNQDNLKSKVKEEISYLDNNLISTLNSVNNLSYDNYKVSSKNIQSNKSDIMRSKIIVQNKKVNLQET